MAGWVPFPSCRKELTPIMRISGIRRALLPAAAEEQVRQAEARVVAARQGIAKSEATLQEVQGRMESAQAARLDTTVKREQFSAAQSMVSQAEAMLAGAKLQPSYTSIHAPASSSISPC